MTKDPFHYIYGPVDSWRLGRSLGVDPISAEQKVCNFNCVYCQLGATARQTGVREVFVPAQKILDEVCRLDPQIQVDYITFSGRGEPTLAQNLGEMIGGVRRCRKERIAVITNSGLIGRADVREDLGRADCVLAKLDACDQGLFEAVDRPQTEARFDEIVDGLRLFAREFSGTLALQLMFIEANKACAKAMAKVAASIGADEIELNTPLRPCGVAPLSVEEMTRIKVYFQDLPGVTMVYERRHTGAGTQVLDAEATVKRHGEYRKDI